MKKIIDLLLWAYRNMTFLETGIDSFGNVMEYDFCKVCGEPEYRHKDNCQAIIWKSKVEHILREEGAIK